VPDLMSFRYNCTNSLHHKTIVSTNLKQNKKKLSSGNNKIISVLNQVPRHDDIWRSGGIAPYFLTPALDGVEWSASRPDRFTPR
jgi:hypothetical protein